MNQDHSAPRSFWLTLIIFSFALSVWAAFSTQARAEPASINLQRSVWGGMFLVYSGVALVCVWLFARLLYSDGLKFKPGINTSAAFWRTLGLIVFIGIVFLIPYIKFHNQIGQEVKEPRYDPGMLLILYYWMCWWAMLLAMAALKIAFNTTWQGGFAAALVLLGITYEVMVRFNAVTDYPLATGWSEGSRYYYASLYFSNLVYGENVPLSTLHPTRYFLQSIPFLIPSLGLAAHRFWQFLLWIGLTAGAAIVLSRRLLTSEQKAFRWLLAGWYFLFILRVGVYYHLEMIVIIPLLFVSMKHPGRSLIAVIAASIWAGVSRVNWFPVPAMIGIAIYLMETPFNGSGWPSLKELFNYLKIPIIWMVAGLVSALAAQALYIPLSGNANNAEAFASSFFSDLLWYRLWPNDNFPLGVVPAILIVSGPLLAILIVGMIRQYRSLHPLRWLGLIGMILVLFAGSLIVSTKIGGGGDLHNMDAYAALLGIIAFFLIGGNIEPETGQPAPDVRPWPVFASALVMPMLFLIPMLSPHPVYDAGQVQQGYEQLVNDVNTLGKNGPVLFINERQMVTFGDVDVPLIPDYEVVTLMEMAMSGNEAYLHRFYDDLAAHRFAAIVSTRQNRIIKKSGPLMEENNVWNRRISPYILCYYEPAQLIETGWSRIQIYVPAKDSSQCR